MIIPICGYGGIGRRAGFRIQWETVQVRPLLPAESMPDSLFCEKPQNFSKTFEKGIDKGEWMWYTMQVAAGEQLRA